LDTAGLKHVEIAEEGISLDEVERALLCRALEQTGENQTRAARLLGISRQTLIYRMEKYEIRRRKAP
jgi:DNA-binding protein Fis